jgi:hypothetical protein
MAFYYTGQLKYINSLIKDFVKITGKSAYKKMPKELYKIYGNIFLIKLSHKLKASISRDENVWKISKFIYREFNDYLGVMLNCPIKTHVLEDFTDTFLVDFNKSFDDIYDNPIDDPNDELVAMDCDGVVTEDELKDIKIYNYDKHKDNDTLDKTTNDYKFIENLSTIIVKKFVKKFVGKYIMDICDLYESIQSDEESDE